MSEANVAIARLAYQAIARGDGRGLWKMLDAAVTSHSFDEVANPARHGRRDVLKFMRRAIRDGSAGELVDVIDVGEQVIVVLRPRMSEGVQPAMRANLTTFADGRVIRMVAYDSPAAALIAAR
jgi:ketosteroid isomerase-like protein